MGPIDGKTEMYGIMGWPVSHSLSPAIHNRAFKALGLNKVYVPFPVQDVGVALNGLRAAGVRGLSVTIPHKQAVIPFLDSIDPVAEKIGAVNTLLIENGLIHGLNTDWLGANQALAEVMELSGSKVLILGAGGSARSIGFGLIEAGAEVTIASRNPERGKGLAVDLGCQWFPLQEAGRLAADAMVNATSVGMEPLVDEMAVTAEILTNCTVVMDIVYAPLKTRLLKEAAAAGCQVVDGLAMLLYQGAAQFKIWTGQNAPVEVMRQELVDWFKD